MVEFTVPFIVGFLCFGLWLAFSHAPACHWCTAQWFSVVSSFVISLKSVKPVAAPRSLALGCEADKIGFARAQVCLALGDTGRFPFVSYIAINAKLCDPPVDRKIS